MLRSVSRYATILSWCKASKLYLAFFFSLGLGFGILSASCSEGTYVSLMRGLCMTPVSIVRLLIVRLLPFLICALIIYKFSSRLFIPLAFLRAFSYGYVLRLVYMAFPGAGWLVWLLLLFSDTAGVFLLFFFWLKNTPVPSHNGFKLLVWCGMAVLLSAVFDYCLLSPYLAMLIKG